MDSEALAERMDVEGWSSSIVVMWDQVAEVILLKVTLKDGTVAWDVSSPWNYVVLEDTSVELDARACFHNQCERVLRNLKHHGNGWDR